MTHVSSTTETRQLSPNTNQRSEAYGASTVKRTRASKDEMEERARFLINYAIDHGPMTVRGLFYQATVAGLPGIDKTEDGYRKIQLQVFKLRREGRLPYWAIADASRIMRKPETYRSWEHALKSTAAAYRKALWADNDCIVEVWVEKNALAGVLWPVTEEYDVPLMATGGFTSETFVYEAVKALEYEDKELMVFALYDFDRSGEDAAISLQEKLIRFGADMDVEVDFNLLGVTEQQVMDMNLPTRPAKRKSAADKRWPHDFAAELDAIPPDDLRAIVRDAIESRLSAGQMARLKEIEAAERDTLFEIIGDAL